MTTLITLLGEQPIPSLLTIRHFSPDSIYLVYTSRTEVVAKNVAVLVDKSVESIQVEPFDLVAIERRLRDQLPRQYGDVVADVTGGTKPMSLALSRIAATNNWVISYLQSQNRESHIYSYVHKEGEIISSRDDIVRPLLTIDEFIRAYGIYDYKCTEFASHEGGVFERSIFEALATTVDEIEHGVQLLGSLDVDLILRRSNRVGLVEVKLGSNGRKKAIDQINTAGGQRYLGTYTKKMIVSNVSWERDTNLRELAAARHITVVSVPNYKRGDKALTEEDRQQLMSAIANWL